MLPAGKASEPGAGRLLLASSLDGWLEPHQLPFCPFISPLWSTIDIDNPTFLWIVRARRPVSVSPQLSSPLYLFMIFVMGTDDDDAVPVGASYSCVRAERRGFITPPW